ncbi:MAG: protein kinase [Myxococcales bacterium]|nr:protein kinase [Myxococcales bacterium]
MLPHTIQPGDRFVIEARVGGGASGDIYKGVDVTTGETVALKLLRQTAPESERTRFLREVAVVADLRHPNIVNYIAHGTWPDGRLFLAMEWLDGEDLSKRQRREPLGTQDAVEVVRRAAQALAAIHARGIVHRDLKLQNIYLPKARGLSVKLIDFGVVKPAVDDGFRTEPGTILGTPQYMSPEQARGESVDPRADVYSLGSVLFRLLTGRNVFETDHAIALLGRIVLEDPPPPSSVRFDIPPTLDAVVHRAIARNREQRYDNAGEFARALARVGPLNNDPPSVERSASAVVPARTTRQSQTDTGSNDSRPTRPGLGVRRVVACVVYDLGETSPDRSISDSLIDVVGQDVRIEVLAGGKTVAVLRVEHSLGDEVMRAARAALTVVSEFRSARVAVSNGHASMARSNLAGEALERAARQLESATPGMIRLDLHAAAALDGRFVIERDADGARLLREDPRELGPRKLLGMPTPTVGREREIAALQEVYADMLRDAFPRIAIVSGPPGIGKSRVRSELHQRLELAPTPPEIMLCRGDSSGTTSGSVSALGRALRAQMGVQDGADLRSQVQKVKRHVRARLPRSLHFLAAFVGELLGVPFPDEADEPLRAARANDQLMQSRIRMALEAYVRTQAGRIPQVLIIEDAHVADDTTIELIDWMLACPGIRMCVFAFAQPEIETRRAGAWSSARLTKLELGPLPPAQSERLVQLALPHASADTRNELVKRAGGNPLVLEELVRCAAEGRHDLPLTVQALVQQRLDRLRPSVRDALRAAAVFGQTFWTAGLAVLVGRNVDADLREAEASEIVLRQTTSRVADTDEWHFRQALVRDAAYASLLEEDLRPMHLAAGAWLESVGNADLGLMAAHFEAGGDIPKATTLFARATRQALANFGQMMMALELARRGLACGADGLERATMLLTQAQVYSRMGRLGECIDNAERASHLVPPASEMWVEAQRLLSASLTESGRSADGDARATWALGPQFLAALPEELRSILLATRVRALVDLNRTAQALTVADDAVACAARAGARGPIAMLRALDARLFALMNACLPGAAVPAGEQLIDAADRAGDLHLASRARINTASTLNYLGRYEDAHALIDRALPDVRSFRLRLLEGSAIHNLGMSYARRGALDEGIEMQRAAVRIAEECSGARLAINARIYWALMLVVRGAPGDLRFAHELASGVVQATTAQPGLQLVALYCLSRVQLARRDLPAAREAAREAHRRLSEGPAEEWEEGVRLGYAEVLLALGQSAEADEVLAQGFEVVRQRVSSIARADYRDSFMRRNEEVARLLELARTRLGKQLTA